jgi:hypothetical protein
MMELTVGSGLAAELSLDRDFLPRLQRLVNAAKI